jgi:hypothetical protein
MAKPWVKNGKWVIIDGKLIWCEICPCTDTTACECIDWDGQHGPLVRLILKLKVEVFDNDSCAGTPVTCTDMTNLNPLDPTEGGLKIALDMEKSTGGLPCVYDLGSYNAAETESDDCGIAAFLFTDASSVLIASDGPIWGGFSTPPCKWVLGLTASSPDISAPAILEKTTGNTVLGEYTAVNNPLCLIFDASTSVRVTFVSAVVVAI